jgi:hypothetical protein
MLCFLGRVTSIYNNLVQVLKLASTSKDVQLIYMLDEVFYIN